MTNYTKEPVLYIDDEIENLDGFKYAFMPDFDITVAQNAKDGLKILEQKDIKVVISDQKMPEISGIEFLNTVKEKYPDTIRIILTAYADVSNAIEAINKGEIYRYLSKPWEKIDLKSTIQNALESYNLKQENKDLIISLKKTNLELSQTNKKLNGKIIEIEKTEEDIRSANEKLLVTTNALKESNRELLKAKKKAEESDHLKTVFINNMSHEIRTPMNGIMGFSQLLNKQDLPDKKRKHYINIIQNSGNQLMRIIDDILEISVLGTKKVKSYNKSVCLNDLLLELFSIFDIKAKENKIPLYLKKGLSDKKSTIFTDEAKLNRILSNLLENALKFTNTGFIEFGYQLKTNNIEIYVKDTGIGIKPEKQKIIFERFSQEEKKLSEKVGGLGLGLSIAKENAELIGGKITLKSEKGRCSTFFVTIPYKPAYSDTEKSIKNDNGKVPEKQEKYTILIVEDEEVNYLYFETLIEYTDLNLNTIHAKHGKEAVEICRTRQDIGLVLMDLKMSIMNGYEATKLIKDFRPDLPIIAQTAYSTTEEKDKAKTSGCDDFISKPISEEIFCEIINKYLISKEKNQRL